MAARCVGERTKCRIPGKRPGTLNRLAIVGTPSAKPGGGSSMVRASGVLAAVVIWALGASARAAEPPKVVAAGEWSKPVADNRARALRGRLVLAEKVVTDERREFVVYVELQDASEAIGGSMRLFCDFGRTDFRPE